jgi:hypothetical protein
MKLKISVNTMKKEEFNKFLEKNAEIISEPLLTEEGFVNEAAINQLEKSILNMPKTHDRLSDNKEWTTKRWTFKKDITRSLAKYSISQSPYSCPDNLEEVIKYLDVCLEREVDWEPAGMAELSLCDISKLLHNILYEQGITCFDNWNKSKKGNLEIQYVSRDSKEDPDYDFIDLDALLHNVCLDIRMERRASDKFDKEFEEKYGESE